ncbi:MAG: patatin-like phospholipase family protein, partial [Proteobacteria bacterium]|nr:patatin-like phospholipase family protein [Pseudomonadota bacterium]
VGIALGGGAALGIAHIGIIRVLEQEGIDIDMVTGSSMGAKLENHSSAYRFNDVKYHAMHSRPCYCG